MKNIKHAAVMSSITAFCYLVGAYFRADFGWLSYKNDFDCLRMMVMEL